MNETTPAPPRPRHGRPCADGAEVPYGLLPEYYYPCASSVNTGSWPVTRTEKT